MNQKNNCPICNGTSFQDFLVCKDYTVSKEDFQIVSCGTCGFHFTNPVPEESKIGAYYQSEDYISHSSTNKGLINKIYLRVRKHTLKQKLKLISRLSKGKHLLDIGAGTGHFLNTCKSAGWNALGLEPDDGARKFAKENLGLDMQPTDDLKNLPDQSRDVITMWHVLEHVYHLNRDITEIVRVLKDDGVLIVAVPNMSSYDAKKYKEYWAAYDVPIHLYHFQPEDIKRLFAKFEMELVEMLPMKFDAYYVSMLSEKYKDGNIVKAFFTGLRSNMRAKNGEYSSQIYVLRKKSI